MLPNRILFDDFFDDLRPLKSQRTMMCDIYEENNAYNVEIDAPGFSKKDFTIECDKGNLKITAEKKEEQKENKKYLHRERKLFERCERSFYLGNINEDEIKAEYSDGILKIIVPKKDETSSKKQITID